MTAIALAHEQVILGGNTPIQGHTTGILKRFMVTNEQRRDQILHLAAVRSCDWLNCLALSFFILQETNLDIWQLSRSHIDIYVPAGSDLPSVLMNTSHVSSTIGAEPVARSITEAGWNLSSLANSTYHGSYHPLYEIDQFVQEVAELNQNIVELHKIGHSTEGREMTAITLSASSIDMTERGRPRPGKLGFVIVGAQHAREVRTFLLVFCLQFLQKSPSGLQQLRRFTLCMPSSRIPPNPGHFDTFSTASWAI